MPLVQDQNGNLLGVDAIPVPRDAMLMFDAPLIPNLKGNPLIIHSGANSIKWSYELNTSVIDTISGAVIQILSCFIGPIRIEGQTAGALFPEQGIGGWTEASFTPVDELMQITDWFLTYMQTAGTSVTGLFRNESAIHFTYPARGWDFYIQVTDLEGFEISKDVVSSPWAITAEVVSENASDYFSGVTMGSFIEPLNNKILQDAISPGKEFAHNPFINPSLKVNQDGAFAAAQVFASDFQGLLASYTTGKFNDWGFSSLQSIPSAGYNDKALGPMNLPGSNYHVTGGMADYWTQQLGGYWVGGGNSLSDYNVVNAGWQGPGSGPGPGGGGGGPPPPSPPPGGGPPPTDCGNSNCYNKTFPTVNDAGCVGAAIDKWMKDRKPTSPLIGQGNLIVSLAKQYNLNPFLYPVVALIESQLGLDCCHHDNSNHNTWGDLTGAPNSQGNPSDCVQFDSFQAATQAYFKNLATNSAYSKAATVCDIIGVASPANLNPDYLSAFLGDFADILKYAGKCISCGSPPPPPKPKDCKSLGNAVAANAMKYVGLNMHYIEGARCWWPPKPLPWQPTDDPCGGAFDCSSFSAAMYDLVGCHIFSGGSDTFNMIGMGTSIGKDPSNAQPGDLVFWDTGKGTQPAHMGVYVGGGKVVDFGHDGGTQTTHSVNIYTIMDIRRYCTECGQ